VHLVTPDNVLYLNVTLRHGLSCRNLACGMVILAKEILPEGLEIHAAFDRNVHHVRVSGRRTKNGSVGLGMVPFFGDLFRVASLFSLFCAVSVCVVSVCNLVS